MTTQTRLQTLTEEITQAYATKFTEAAALGAKDPVAMAKAIGSITAEIETKARERIKTEKDALDALAKTEAAGKTALETHAQDVLGKAFETLRAGFESLQTVGQLIGRLDKDKDGKMTVSIVVGNLTKATNGTGTRSHKIVIDGKQYDTVMVGWKAVMGDVPQPTKEVVDAKATGGKRQSATRNVAVTALEAAGHKIS